MNRSMNDNIRWIVTRSKQRICRSLMVAPVLLLAAVCDPALVAGQQALSAPSLSVPSVGYYCSATRTDGAWWLHWGAEGDGNANPCSSVNGANRVWTGAYRAAPGSNRVDVSCTGYWNSFVGAGHTPLQAAFNTASGKSACEFKVTMGGGTRSESPGSLPVDRTHLDIPNASDPNYTLNATTFTKSMNAQLQGHNPQPYGYQVAVRDPAGALVVDYAWGSASGLAYPTVANTPMDPNRRQEIGSTSKTITAVALLAAMQDLKDRGLSVMLDSPINSYLPSDWSRNNLPTGLNAITFRDLMQHTSGFFPTGKTCGGHSCNGNPKVYADLQEMVELAPIGDHAFRTKTQYHNANYSLLRILIPYLVDGPQAYASWGGMGDYTAAAYRNYVRGRLFASIGLSDVDAYWTGTSPVTVLFNAERRPVVNHVNITHNSTTQTYTPSNAVLSGDLDERPNLHLREAGAGRWELSAKEYSLFISHLWRNTYFPSTTDVYAHQGNYPAGYDISYGAGMGRFWIMLPNGYSNLAYYHSGGAPYLATAWVTFNGYTAVVHLNTAYPKDLDPANALAKAFQMALVPAAWSCNDSYHGATDGCDCNCGSWDPDCDDPKAKVYDSTTVPQPLKYCKKTGSAPWITGTLTSSP